MIHIVLVLLFLLPFSATICKASDGEIHASSSKRRGYSHGEQIPLFANKVFGADGRCQSDSYFSLPFCPPGEEIPKRKKSLNEILAGDCLTITQYEFKFGVSDSEVVLCRKHMTEDELERFRVAIANKIEYQMYFGNIFFGGRVGETIEETGLDLGQKICLFNHIEFKVDFMENQVMGISIVNSLYSSVDITNITETTVEFSYTVFWHEINPTNISNYFISNKTAAKKTLWLSEEDRLLVFLSVWLWTGIAFWWIALPLVIASPYLIWYFVVNGNKQPHEGTRRLGDKACLCPSFVSLLGAILGIGTQHLIIIGLLLVYAYKGVYPCNSHFENISVDFFVMSYCLTSVPCAFLARFFHEKFSFTGWKECVFQTWALYIFPVFIAVLMMMFVTTTLMVGYAVYTLLVAGFCSVILLYLCCIAIRNLYRPERKAVICGTKRLTRLNIPPTFWYMKTPGQMIFVGLGTFLQISPVMDKFYASLWGLKVCGSFFTLFRVFFVVVFTTIISGIVLTFIQLFNHDYDWWWRSVLRGGSTAVYMLVYGIYFLSRMKLESYGDFVPLLVYTICVCYSFFLVLGTVGFTASQIAYKLYVFRFFKKRQ